MITELFIVLISAEEYLELKMNIKKMIPLNNFIIFSLPGGLWMFSSTLLFKDFYIEIKKLKIELLFVPLIFCVFLELFQLTNITNGRFDIFDIITYLLFGVISIYLFQSKNNKKELLTPFTINSFISIVCFLIVYLAHVWQ